MTLMHRQIKKSIQVCSHTNSSIEPSHSFRIDPVNSLRGHPRIRLNIIFISFLFLYFSYEMQCHGSYSDLYIMGNSHRIHFPSHSVKKMIATAIFIGHSSILKFVGFILQKLDRWGRKASKTIKTKGKIIGLPTSLIISL